MQKIIGITIFLFFALSPAAPFVYVVYAEEFTSTNFRILDPVITVSAVTEATSTNFRLTSSVGQPAIGTTTASSFNTSGGFLYFPIVSGLTTAAAADGKVGLHWTGASGLLGWTVSGYNVGTSTSAGGPYTYASKGASTTAVIMGLTNENTYYFVVRVEDAFGNVIATTSEVSATPTANHYELRTGDYAASAASSTEIVNTNSTKCLYAIPADFLTAGIAMHSVVFSASEASVIGAKPLPGGKLAADTFWDISFFKNSDLSAITSSDGAITLTFTYTDADISGIDESTLKPYRWNGSGWAELAGATIDTSANKVTVASTLLSTFSLLGSAPVSAVTPPAATGGGGDSGAGIGGAARAQAVMEIKEGEGLIAKISALLKQGEPYLTADLNNDGKFGIEDLSVLLYFRDKPVNEAIDLNKDGKIGLADLSILFYRWTGTVITAEEDLQKTVFTEGRIPSAEKRPEEKNAFIVSAKSAERISSYVSMIFKVLVVLLVINFLWRITLRIIKFSRKFLTES